MKKQPTKPLPESIQTMQPLLVKILEQMEMVQKRLDRSEERSSCDALLNRTMDELARTLLLTDHGQRYEACIELAISRYRKTREELEWTRTAGFPALVQGEVNVVVEGVLRVLHKDLLRLGVELHEVKPGTVLDRDRHYVVEQRQTACAEELNTVCRCVMPGFSWKMKNKDAERTLPANVHVCTTLMPLFDVEPADSAVPDFVPVSTKPR